MRCRIFLILIILLSFCFPAKACTLWAASGKAVIGGGSLIVKNRDGFPNHQQEIKIIKPKKGYSYLGLFSLSKNDGGLKAGINEKGFAVISAVVSTIPYQERKAISNEHGILVKLLKECSSVDAALAKKKLFLKPEFLMLADKYKVVLVEIGPKGKCSVVSRENGYLFHTNHYVLDCLSSFNKISDISSEKRYARIGTLLKNHPEPYNFEQFLALSNDENDGPDNSIFRTGGNKHKARTLATWAVAIPAKGYPELYIKLLNPGEKEKIIRIRAEYVFNEVYQGKELWNL